MISVSMVLSLAMSLVNDYESLLFCMICLGVCKIETKRYKSTIRIRISSPSSDNVVD